MPDLKGQLGSGLIDPEDECGGESDSGQEGVSAAVVSGMDSSPVLEAGEGVLDLVALAVENRIVVMLDAVFCMGRNARSDAALDEGIAEADRAIGTVGEQVAGWRQVLE